MIPVLIAIVVIAIVALIAFRWFEGYRYTDAWRKSEFRGLAFGFLMWFGGLFGHRVPPPPQAKTEFATKPGEPSPPNSGGPPLPDQAADEEE
jgi:type II secretory pathway pseudopilin PulG